MATCQLLNTSARVTCKSLKRNKKHTAPSAIHRNRTTLDDRLSSTNLSSHGNQKEKARTKFKQVMGQITARCARRLRQGHVSLWQQSDQVMLHHGRLSLLTFYNYCVLGSILQFDRPNSIYGAIECTSRRCIKTDLIQDLNQSGMIVHALVRKLKER